MTKIPVVRIMIIDGNSKILFCMVNAIVIVNYNDIKTNIDTIKYLDSEELLQSFTYWFKNL